MSDGQRVYSDEEFAIILRKATELATAAEPDSSSSSGLTLSEMKAAAAQVGLDPALVERAARSLVLTAKATPIERLIGGPLRHTHEIHFPVTLDKVGAARLLSAVHISAGHSGSGNPGHSSALGMTFRDGGDSETLSVTAQPEEDGTSVSVVLDRRGTFGVTVMASGIAMFLANLFVIFALYPESPVQGLVGAAVLNGGILTAWRGYWASSTKRARARITSVIDAIGKTLK